MAFTLDTNRQPRTISENTSISLDIGAEMILNIPVDKNNSGTGAFPEEGPLSYLGVEYTLIQGFGIEYNNVGTLESTDNSDCLEVKYKHNQPSNQTIYFFATDGRISKFSIIRVPVHDHSSIHQGGPAHGTYYSESALQGDDT